MCGLHQEMAAYFEGIISYIDRTSGIREKEVNFQLNIIQPLLLSEVP